MKKSILLLLIIGVIAISNSCNKKLNEHTIESMAVMDYDKKWAEVDSLLIKKLLKSALAEVEKIYAYSKSNEEDVHFLKSIIYKGRLLNDLKEDGTENLLLDLQKEIESATFPSKHILQSVLAEFYFQFAQASAYRYSNRTEVLNEDPEDLRTWSLSTFLRKSVDYADSSISNMDLKTQDLLPYNLVLKTFNETNDFVLDNWYDLLLYRATKIYAHKLVGVADPIRPFNLDEESYFDNLDLFCDKVITSNDKNSTVFKTISSYQKLLKSLRNSGKDETLLDLDLRRLDFVWNNSNHPDKSELYGGILEKMHSQYSSNELQGHISYAWANFLFTSGQAPFIENDDELVWNFKKAHDICSGTVSKFPNSSGSAKCKYLIYLIERKQLELKTEAVIPSNTKALANISYQNITKVYTKLVRFEDEDILEIPRLNQKQLRPFLLRKTVVKSNEYDLPDKGDYRQHSIDVLLDPLELGNYALLISDSKDFSDSSHFNLVRFIVSDLSYSFNEQGLEGLVVTSRKTGSPLTGVKLEFFQRQYNSKTRKSENILATTAYTDENGRIKSDSKLQNFTVRLSYEDDILDSRLYHGVHYDGPRKEFGMTHVFTDRAIYRPGQVVFFKGIILNYNKHNIPSIVTNGQCEVVLYDANNQEIDKLKLGVNEFGSFNGTFTSPQGGLGGVMRIVATSKGSTGRKNIRVEEYKRPKFEVVFDPLNKASRLGDTVEINGSGIYFAGAPVDRSIFKYRVVREVHIPYYFSWRYPGRTQSQEIANGNGNTDGSGRFSFSFLATPDLKINKSNNPVFSYKIIVDLVDGTGETISNTEVINLGYSDLILDFELPEEADLIDLDSLSVITRNTNGDKIPASGNIQFIKLIEPDVIKRKRHWSLADTSIYSKKFFKTELPYFTFNEEDELRNWKESGQEIQFEFNTSIDSNYDIKYKLKAGVYKVIASSADKFGNEVKTVKFIKLSDFANNRFPKTKDLWTRINKKVFRPGDQAIIDLGTVPESLNIYYEIEKDQNIVKSSWIDVRETDKIELDISEQDYGDFYVHFYYSLLNRTYSSFIKVDVPWSHKRLDISFETFRDKLKPGQEEEWKIKISGEDKDAISAEILASMYDASLDQILSHKWDQSFYTRKRKHFSRNGALFNASNQRRVNRLNTRPPMFPKPLNYPDIDLEGFSYWQYGFLYARSGTRQMTQRGDIAAMEMKALPDSMEPEASGVPGAVDEFEEASTKGTESPAKLRTNLNETVFFFPDLRTDESGNVILKFTMNEALTKWKLQLFAHTKDLDYVFDEKSIITQKELMVFPNPPRFLRTSDVLNFAAKISNLTDQQITGEASLEIFDAISMKALSHEFGVEIKNIPFAAEANQSDHVEWKLKVPAGFVGAITYRVKASSERYSDGEENSLPVLSNMILVTDSWSIPLKGEESKTYRFDEFIPESDSAVPHRMSLEFNSNPAWYAVKALPYLMEYPHSCTEQVFNRYYSNVLAKTVANNHPKIKRVFEAWKNIDPQSLQSNLSKNQELKSALLEETPWVLDAQSEERQMRDIGLLFDLNKMAGEEREALNKIVNGQLPNGGFSWFPGGRDNWYVTQYIIEGLGHLRKLNVTSTFQDQRMLELIKKAIDYMDQRMVEHYEKLQERTSDNSKMFTNDHLDYILIHYLYARSFFPEYDMTTRAEEAKTYYLNQSKNYWVDKGLYSQAMIALVLHRNDSSDDISKLILKSIKERAIHHDELGMYWKGERGYLWYQLPIEMHALMIESFNEVVKDSESVELMKIWLLKNKQTSSWNTTKSTASAIYALLMNGDNWLLEDQSVAIQIDEVDIDLAGIIKEAGTGYFKKAWNKEELESGMEEISFSNPNKSVAWGGLYYQYFEKLENIHSFKETPLSIDKKIFKEVNTNSGPKLLSLDDDNLKKGDKVIVRIELRVDRPMEFVHMKDMRASGFEPIHILSTYKWQGMLGYYESTKDLATHFFFEYLPKGTHVFEYPLRATHSGEFSNGISTIQSMYAPEFSSHSQGIKVEIVSE